jgi:nitroreductase
MQSLKNLVFANRSYRRFYAEVRVPMATLKDLVDLARLCPSARNAQPLRYVVSCDDAKNELIFSCLRWARDLNWPGPQKDERPAAYIVILNDTVAASAFFPYDCGIAAQTILLGAVEKGLGGCMLGSIDKERLRESLKIPSQYEIVLVIALGKPKEKVHLETLDANGTIKYWRDADQVHHVPKRPMEDIVLDL